MDRGPGHNQEKVSGALAPSLCFLKLDHRLFAPALPPCLPRHDGLSPLAEYKETLPKAAFVTAEEM